MTAVSRVVLNRRTTSPKTTIPKKAYPKKMGNTAVMYCGGIGGTEGPNHTDPTPSGSGQGRNARQHTFRIRGAARFIVRTRIYSLEWNSRNCGAGKTAVQGLPCGGAGRRTCVTPIHAEAQLSPRSMRTVHHWSGVWNASESSWSNSAMEKRTAAYASVILWGRCVRRMRRQPR